MKKLLKGYNEQFLVEINLPRNRVIQIIAREKDKKRDFFNFISSNPLDFREITASDEKIIINVKPKWLNPYRGIGQIHLKL